MPAKKNVLTDSATVAINNLAQQKQAAGIRIYNLSAGEPKLAPHPVLIESVNAALKAGKIFYPPVAGMPELRQLAVEWMNQHYATKYQMENCVVVSGGKFGIYLLAQLLLQPDDEVIIPAPYWVSYPTIAELFGGVPVIVDTNAGADWKMTPQQLEQACTNKSRVLILNNAANPTGTLYTRDELAALLAIANKHGLRVISDEVYSGLVYGSNTYTSCAAFPEYADNVFIIQSCSKHFAMTGWRVGFVFGDDKIIKQMITLVGQSTSGVNALSQCAAIAAFKHAPEVMERVKQAMQQQRDLLVNALNEHFSLALTPPASSLYVFVAVSDLTDKNIDSVAFCKEAIEHAHVALVPGVAFGKEGFVRFTFGAEKNDIIAGIKALADFC